MCGRNALFLDADDLTARFDATFADGVDYEPRYNIAPGDHLKVITNEAPEEIVQYHWGLIPFWADEPQEGFINARPETAAEKRSFQQAWEARPCLVLSSGFYEWRARNGRPKRPYRIHRENDVAFAMASLWEVWEGNDAEQQIPSMTILTIEPNDTVAPIHDRMPVVLPKGEEETWLEAGPDERQKLCQPYPGDDLDSYEISTRVNDPANDDPRVIEPLGGSLSELEECGLVR